MPPMHVLRHALRAPLLRLMLAATLALSPLTGAAATPAPWPNAAFSYLATNETLEHVLTEFGRTFGLRVELTQGVIDHRVRLNGNITTASPDEFLNRLSMSHGAQWFMHGGVLHVSLTSDGVTRVLPAPGVAGIRQALSSLGVVDARFGWADLPERSAVMVSGPPAYVELVARTLSTLPPAPTEQEVRVFRLRHASVDDRVIQYRDKEIVTTGVASLLRGLMTQGDQQTGTSTQTVNVSSFKSAPAPSSAEGASSSKGGDKAGGKADLKAEAPVASTSADTPARGATPARADNRRITTVQADSRLNALIVRDLPERMPMYEQLIASLDVPSYLIQIEAMIVDVSTTQAKQLGVDWQARRRIGRNTYASGGFGQPDTPPGPTTGLITLAGDLALAGNFLMARIDALETSGDARIVSRPSVLTVDNLGALIDLSETVYLSAIGERVANIVPVSAGVTLKVTPHVIEQGGQRSVQLTVDIEDGSIDTTGKQPSVRRSTVGTQAVMAQDESLLIGGFRTEQDTKRHERLPIVGDLPLVGALFGKKTSSVERTERMFVITPRIIEPLVMQPTPKAK